jgi:hypothetical protein
MNLTPEQKQHATDLIEMGEKLQAVRYFKETLNISLEEAMTLTEKLEEEIEGDASFAHFQSAHKTGSSSVNVGRLVGTIFMFIGVILLGIAVWIYSNNNQFEKRAERVMGKVSGYDNYESSNDDGGSTTMYTPIFEYSFNGKDYLKPGSVSSSSPDFEIGEPVEILVDPLNPEEILIESFSQKWLGIIILLVLGTIFTGVGYLVFRLMAKSPSVQRT